MTAPTVPSRRLALPTLLFLLAVLVPLRMQVGPILLTGVRGLLLVMVLPLAINLVRGRYGQLILADYLFFAHVAWIAIALSQTTPQFAISQMGSVGIEFIGGYLIGRAYVRGPAQMVAVVRFLAVAVLLLLPVVLYELRTGRPILIELLNRLPALRSAGIVNIEGRLGLERVQAVFAHPIHFGIFCSSLFALTLIGLKGAVSEPWRILLGAVVGFGAFASLSSGAILPMMMQLSLIFWAGMLHKVRARWLILAALAAIGYVVIDLLSNRTPLMVFFSYATFSPHNAYWRAQIFDWGWMNIFGNTSQNIPPAPIFGIGMNDWVRPHYMYSGSMDNFWLVMGVRYGVPGFLTVAIGYLWTLWWIARRPLPEGTTVWRMRRAWVITMFALAICMCTVHLWTAIYAYAFFMLGAGVWLLEAQPEEAGTSVPAAVRTGRYTRFEERPTTTMTKRRAPSTAPPSARPARRTTTPPRFARPAPRGLGNTRPR